MEDTHSLADVDMGQEEEHNKNSSQDLVVGEFRYEVSRDLQQCRPHSNSVVGGQYIVTRC